MLKESDLFDPADFESIEFALLLKNLTTDREWSDQGKLAILEVGEKSLTISVPPGATYLDNHVTLQLFRVTQGHIDSKPVFHSTGKVTELTESGNGFEKAVITLVQFDKKSWADFLGIFSKRQDEISKFFEMGKK